MPFEQRRTEEQLLAEVRRVVTLIPGPPSDPSSSLTGCLRSALGRRQDLISGAEEVRREDLYSLRLRN